MKLMSWRDEAELKLSRFEILVSSVSVSYGEIELIAISSSGLKDPS